MSAAEVNKTYSRDELQANQLAVLEYLLSDSDTDVTNTEDTSGSEAGTDHNKKDYVHDIHIFSINGKFSYIDMTIHVNIPTNIHIYPTKFHHNMLHDSVL